MPFFCWNCKIEFDGDEERFNQPCQRCGNLSPTTGKWYGRSPSKIPSSYFDTSLGVYIRGQKEKSRILNERGLVEIGNEKIPDQSTWEPQILTDREWQKAWNETTNTSSSDENGDA